MTARARINRRVVVVKAMIYAGFAMCVLGLLSWQALDRIELCVLGIAGFAVAWLTMMSTWVIGIIRCPHCRGRLTNLAMHDPGLRIDPSVHFCPYCGLWLDEEYDSDPAVTPES